jgi:hypothetical protein
VSGTVICQGAPSLLLPLYYGDYASTIAVSQCNGATNYNVWWAPEVGVFGTANINTPTTGAWLYTPGNTLTPTTSTLGCNGGFWVSTSGTLFEPPPRRAIILPAVIRAGRRAVRRSIDIYARFRGMDEVRRFIRGERITFEGQFFDYHVRKTVKVLTQTMHPDGPHIPYSLKLARKGEDRPLASGCIIVPSLPVIDQLLALSFHLQDPADELKLLETTNWSPSLPRNWREELRVAA